MQRVATEQERIATEQERIATDVQRIATEQSRLSETLDRLRIDAVARMDRLDNNLTLLRDDVGASLGRAQKA
jgi:predicted nuclease with TOPRIM domain